jgi:dipeptidyl-peptidase-4
MYVYGGPGSQTVQNDWSPYGRGRHQFHQLLAQRGFIVASVDNRGTGARGRDFKNATYLELGRLETIDQIAAGRHLASLAYVDPARIGIWGWSYGGFMTLLALEQGSDVFAGGISVAPVSSWRFYDTIYTERFMRTPAENPDGYDENSPLTYPERLEDPLLLVHGTGDDNVHFQNTVQMVAALQEAGKPFDLMIYPNKTHAIAGTNTRIHLYSMMLDWWTETLMPGG